MIYGVLSISRRREVMMMDYGSVKDFLRAHEAALKST